MVDFKHEIFDIIRQFTAMGLLETKIKKAYGNPTTHYKLDKSEFTQ